MLRRILNGMYLRQLLQMATLVVAAVASGQLECSPQLALNADQRQGRDLYARMCAVCHGRQGEGYAADQAPALAQPDFLASVSDQFLRSAIANGRAGTTMSAWSTVRGGPLAPRNVDALIAFLDARGTRTRATLDERSDTGNAVRGAEVYARECQRCHGARGTGGPNVHIGDPELLAGATNGFLRHAIGAGRPGTPMPPFAALLADGAIDDVVALLRSWQAHASSVARYAPPARPLPLPLGPVPLNPRGPEPAGFRAQPATTGADAVKAQLDRGARMALLDARAPSDYLGEHIAGAVSVPFYDPEPYISQLPKDAWLVCYCACPHAESGQLAQKLVQKGFTKVTVLDEGLGVWKGRKYPTHTGVDP